MYSIRGLNRYVKSIQTCFVKSVVQRQEKSKAFFVSNKVYYMSKSETICNIKSSNKKNSKIIDSAIGLKSYGNNKIHAKKFLVNSKLVFIVYFMLKR
jgi:hypothetical protein